MALIVKDRVRVTTSTTGTGTLTLGSAVATFQDFSVIGNGNTTYYAIVDSNSGDWEVGLGTYTSSGTTLSRDTILESSNGGTAVNFGAGVKDVFCTYPAEKSIADGKTNVIEVSSTDPALRITQLGTGNALLVEDSANPDSSPFVVDASGKVISGSTETPTGFADAGFNVIGRDTFYNSSITRITDNSSAPQLFFQKSRGTFASPTIVSSGDSLGLHVFYGFDGANARAAAQITAAVDGTPGTNDMPGRLTFSTTADGSSSPTENMRITNDGTTFIRNGTSTTNTNSSRLVVGGTISETVSSTQYLVASQYDVGSAPNQLPVNGYLGALAYEDTETPALDVGTGITTGTGTICVANGGLSGGVYKVTIVIDLTGLNSGGTAGDIIGVDGTALPCYIARLPAMTVLGGRMTCLELPAGGDTDIDLYSANEGTGTEDSAITGLTETQIINAGTQALGTLTYFSAYPTTNQYLYLVGQSTSNATYTAGRFLIEIFGVQ